MVRCKPGDCVEVNHFILGKAIVQLGEKYAFGNDGLLCWETQKVFAIFTHNIIGRNVDSDSFEKAMFKVVDQSSIRRKLTVEQAEVAELLWSL